MFEPHLRQLGAMEDQGEVELGRGDVISTTDLRTSPGEYPVYSSSAVGTGQFGRYGKYMFDEDLITWSVDGGGRPFLRKKHKFSVTNVSGFLRIRKPDVWNYGYLHAAMVKAHQRVQFDYQMKAHPSVIRELYKLRWVPLDEQQKIAQILDTLDTQIQKTEALIAKLEKIKEGLLHDLLTRGIDENGQLRPSPEQAPELYEDSALGLIPKEWELTPLGQVAESMIDGPFGSNLKTSHYVEEAGVQVVRLQNIKTGEFDETFTAFITRAHANQLDKNQVVSGDLLVAALGDERSKPGRACLYPAHLPPAINKADCFRVRAQPSKATNSFLMHCLNFERSSKQANAKQQGVTLQRVNLSNLRTIVIGLPTIAEQELISDQLNTIAREISALEYERQKLESTKSGLMDDLLTGRVRVTPLLKDAV